MNYSLGIFSTFRDEAALKLFHSIYQNIASNKIKGKIAYIFCNREYGEDDLTDRLLKEVEKYSLPLICFSSCKFQPLLRKQGMEETRRMKRESVPLMEWREKYDREIIRRVENFTVDLIVFAGYMLITSKELCSRYDMINLHPAPPDGPKGAWEEVIWELISQKSPEAGAMMHLVTPELDRGPVVSYYTFPIQGEEYQTLWQQLEEQLPNITLEEIKREAYRTYPLFYKIREEEFRREIPLVVLTLREFTADRIKILDKKPYYQSVKGVCLNQEIDEYWRDLCLPRS